MRLFQHFLTSLPCLVTAPVRVSWRRAMSYVFITPLTVADSLRNESKYKYGSRSEQNVIVYFSRSPSCAPAPPHHSVIPTQHSAKPHCTLGINSLLLVLVIFMGFVVIGL